MEKNTENILVAHDVKVKQVWFDEHRVYFELLDGRAVGAPLEWFPRLHKATTPQKNNWQLVGLGRGVYWPDLDEHLSAAGMLTFQK